MIDIVKYNLAIELLCSAPDTQIDKIARDRIAKLKIDENSDMEAIKKDFLSVIDVCCYASLASDFAMKALYQTFFMIGTKEDFNKYKNEIIIN